MTGDHLAKRQGYDGVDFPLRWRLRIGVWV